MTVLVPGALKVTGNRVGGPAGPTMKSGNAEMLGVVTAAAGNIAASVPPRVTSTNATIETATESGRLERRRNILLVSGDCGFTLSAPERCRPSIMITTPLGRIRDRFGHPLLPLAGLFVQTGCAPRSSKETLPNVRSKSQLGRDGKDESLNRRKSKEAPVRCRRRVRAENGTKLDELGVRRFTAIDVIAP